MSNVVKLFVISLILIDTTQLNSLRENSSVNHATAWDGATYSANSSLQYDFGTATLTKIIFTGTEHVLDLGCGDGRITALIANKVPQGNVVGADCSLDMVEFAQATYGPKTPNLSFVRSYIEDITYSNEFDIVTSFFTLHWIPNLSRAFSNIYNALKPGGHMLLFFPMSYEKTPLVAYEDTWHRLQADIIAQTTWQSLFEKNKPAKGHRAEVTTEYLTNLCKQTGFVSFEVKGCTLPYTFPTADKLKSWMRAISSFKAIPAEHQEEYLNNIISRVQRNNHPGDNTCTIYLSLATVLATK